MLENNTTHIVMWTYYSKVQVFFKSVILLSIYRSVTSICILRTAWTYSNYLIYLIIHAHMRACTHALALLRAMHTETLRCVIYALLFESSVTVGRLSVPENKSLTGTLYNVLSSVAVTHYETQPPGTGVGGIIFLQCFCPQRYRGTKLFQKKRAFSFCQNPELAACDFWLYPYIKDKLTGRVFEFHSADSSTLLQCLSMKHVRTCTCVHKCIFWMCIQALEKCIQISEEFFTPEIVKTLHNTAIFPTRHNNHLFSDAFCTSCRVVKCKGTKTWY